MNEVNRYQKNCMYCEKGEKVDQNYIEIEPLHVSTLYLNRDQTHKGRCALVLNWHVDEPFQLSEVERNEFFADMARAAKAIYKAFNPGKINYGTYGDVVSHYHVHIVPKYKQDSDWNDAFVNNPSNPVNLTDKQYEEIISNINKFL